MERHAGIVPTRRVGLSGLATNLGQAAGWRLRRDIAAGVDRRFVEGGTDVQLSKPMHRVAALVPVGTTFRFAKTVAESEVYLFCGMTGDLNASHVNEVYMATTRFGHRLAPGGLVFSYMAACVTKLLDRLEGISAVSYGYDGVRFVRPVLINDTVTISYTVRELDGDRSMIRSQIVIANQNEEVVVAGSHSLKVVSMRPSSSMGDPAEAEAR